MSGQAICEDLPSATFLPESADGPLPWILPDGREICPVGLAQHLANLSARQVKAMGLQISGISGRRGSTSSESAALSASLASRLQAQLGTDGSTLYAQTWKQKATPSGALYWEHTASARRTSDSGCTGWPTPAARDWKDGSRCDAVPTNALLGRVVWLAGWPTPTAQDCSRGSGTYRPQDTGIPLPQRVAMIDTDHPARLTAHGELLIGSDAGMGSGGQLNPEHSRWLQGFRGDWATQAPGFADWRAWQDLIQRASSEPSGTDPKR